MTRVLILNPEKINMMHSACKIKAFVFLTTCHRYLQSLPSMFVLYWALYYPPPKAQPCSSLAHLLWPLGGDIVQWKPTHCLHPHARAQNQDFVRGCCCCCCPDRPLSPPPVSPASIAAAAYLKIILNDSLAAVTDCVRTRWSPWTN